MRAERLFAAGASVALVGLVLLIVEVVRTLGSSTLGGIGTALLWVGVGLLAVGAIALTLAVARATAEPVEPSSDEDARAAEPA